MELSGANLLSSVLGGFVGSVITSIASYNLWWRQQCLQDNQFILNRLYELDSVIGTLRNELRNSVLSPDDNVSARRSLMLEVASRDMAMINCLTSYYLLEHISLFPEIIKCNENYNDCAARVNQSPDPFAGDRISPRSPYQEFLLAADNLDKKLAELQGIARDKAFKLRPKENANVHLS